MKLGPTELRKLREPHVGDVEEYMDGSQLWNITTGVSMSCSTGGAFPLTVPHLCIHDEMEPVSAIRGWRCRYCGTYYPGLDEPSMCYDSVNRISHCGGGDFEQVPL